jgi:hypothetical protein
MSLIDERPRRRMSEAVGAACDEHSSHFFLYYPSRRQQPAALSALIDMVGLEANERK